MAKWRPKNIYIYFNDIFGSMGENCLPYMPESFTCNINGRNEEIDILHGVGSDEGLAGTMNFVKRPGLKTWSIECFFSHPDRPLYATVNRSHHWTPEFWVEFFESAMYQRKVLEMTVSGLDIVTYVTIENFKHTKEAGEEIDTYYTIEIKEYQFQEIKQEAVNIVQEVPKYDGQNINQQATKPNIDINNDGNCVWLDGRAWKGFSPIQGLSAICCDNSFNRSLHFSWLKIKVLDKRINFVSGIRINDKVNTEIKFAINSYSFGVQPTNIEVYERLWTIFNSALNKLPQYQQYAQNYSNCIKQYVRLAYGDVNTKMSFANFKSSLNQTMNNILMSLLSSNDYEKIKSCVTNRGIKIDENIVKVRGQYVGSWIDAMAVADVIGGERICHIEAQEGYSYTGSAGDLKRLEYQGIQDKHIVYTLNKGDKMWCLEDDIRLQNDSNIPFSLTYYSE